MLTREEIIMTNNFGKFCRKLRIDRGELLLDMATKLDVSPAFLSKVENGKKKPPKEWRDKLIELYELNVRQSDELDECLYEAQNYESIDISSWNDNDRMLMLSFARGFEKIDKEALRQLINKEGGNE